MIDIKLLRDQAGKEIELEFSDGHVVRGVLLSADEDPAEILYRVIRVLEQGPAQYAGIKVGTIASADLTELKTFRTE
jgi:small nuclear ribonucleoprotein (snRNP)-like protein